MDTTHNRVTSSDHAAGTDEVAVALVCMPFHLAIRPSIQLGLLKAISAQAGFSAETHYLNLKLSGVFGHNIYQALCRNHQHLLCEWLFSVAAFGPSGASSDCEYFDAFPDLVSWARTVGLSAEELSQLRHSVLPKYVDECLTATDWGRYRVVGFTSTYQQHVASLALARRIKEVYPNVTIVFGGANMVGEMGVEHLRAFTFIDYAVLGDGDLAFPGLLKCILDGRAPEDLPGVAERTSEGVRVLRDPEPFTNLDSLPTPDYDEYFDHAKRLDLLHHPEFAWAIPFESSRGCWWGQKHQCTFCGFTQLGLAYRSKSPKRVLHEVGQLANKYRATFFQASDSIVDMQYIPHVFNEVEKSKIDYQFYYETKSNLTREQIASLFRGGVRSIQPGIESLSTRVLKLMRKGCTMLQNIRFLKWCRYYGIRVSWNLLWGFPGETLEDYEQQLEIFKVITHLEPPEKYGRIWLERYSPYYRDAERFGFVNVRPQDSYRYVYPSSITAEKIAMFFDYEVSDTVSDSALSGVIEALDRWSKHWEGGQPGRLSYRRTADSVFVDDSRAPANAGTRTLYGPMADIYEYCGDTIRSVEQVAQFLHTRPASYMYPTQEVEDALSSLCEAGLMLGEDGKFLSLAIPANPNW